MLWYELLVCHSTTVEIVTFVGFCSFHLQYYWNVYMYRQDRQCGFSTHAAWLAAWLAQNDIFQIY